MMTALDPFQVGTPPDEMAPSSASSQRMSDNFQTPAGRIKHIHSLQGLDEPMSSLSLADEHIDFQSFLTLTSDEDQFADSENISTQDQSNDLPVHSSGWFGQRPFAVIRIHDIPADLSIEEIEDFFMPLPGVHIIMNRKIGITLPECYVEFPSYLIALRALELNSNKKLRGRPITLSWSSQHQFMNALFPTATVCKSTTVSPEKPINLNVNINATDNVFDLKLLPGNRNQVEYRYVPQQEIDALLRFCQDSHKRYALQAISRPFENCISMLVKVPWETYGLVSSEEKQALYDMLIAVIEILKGHIAAGRGGSLNVDLLLRMLRCGACVPAFTRQEKLYLINGLQCPQDLIRFVYFAPSHSRLNFH
ncbi:hypothetical protein HDU76_005891 [Blyttiomyces sp. JEL0837]|nr:hypothetical protein HDU76_005891 [Blyttiomyces sp. JEL0837]